MKRADSRVRARAEPRSFMGKPGETYIYNYIYIYIYIYIYKYIGKRIGIHLGWFGDGLRAVFFCTPGFDSDDM